MKKRMILFAIAGGFLSYTLIAPGLWMDLFSRLASALRGGRGESSDWGEPLFYLPYMLSPGILVGLLLSGIFEKFIRKDKGVSRDSWIIWACATAAFTLVAVLGFQVEIAKLLQPRDLFSRLIHLSPHPGLREETMGDLVRLDDADKRALIPRLQERLQDKDESVRKNAADVLREIEQMTNIHHSTPTEQTLFVRHFPFLANPTYRVPDNSAERAWCDLAWRTSAKQFGSDDVLTALAINGIGIVDLSEHHYRNAESMFARAISIMQKNPQENRAVLVAMLQNQARVLRQTKRPQDAERLEADALALSHGGSHENRKN